MHPPRILDPRGVPVIGHDGHLPALAPDRLTPQSLRRRFAGGGSWAPEFGGDSRQLPGPEPAPASVLVPLVHRAEGMQVLLTLRAAHLRAHGGQISFPGGRAEPHDADPAATALREAAEEVGLAPACVEVLGQMPRYATVTGFIVTPVVALVQTPFDLALDRAEVDEAFEVPLAFLMDPQHHRRHRHVDAQGQRMFLSMPWQVLAADGTAREYFIWGATAAMLRNLYRFLAV